MVRLPIRGVALLVWIERRRLYKLQKGGRDKSTGITQIDQYFPKGPGRTFESCWAGQSCLNHTFRPHLMKTQLLLSIALIAAVLAGCKGEDAVAKCVQANINSDIDSGKLKKTDSAAIKQFESMHRATCIENMTPKAY